MKLARTTVYNQDGSSVGAWACTPFILLCDDYPPNQWRVGVLPPQEVWSQYDEALAWRKENSFDALVFSTRAQALDALQMALLEHPLKSSC